MYVWCEVTSMNMAFCFFQLPYMRIRKAYIAEFWIQWFSDIIEVIAFWKPPIVSSLKNFCKVNSNTNLLSYPKFIIHSIKYIGFSEFFEIKHYFIYITEDLRIVWHKKICHKKNSPAPAKVCGTYNLICMLLMFVPLESATYFALLQNLEKFQSWIVYFSVYVSPWEACMVIQNPR